MSSSLLNNVTSTSTSETPLQPANHEPDWPEIVLDDSFGGVHARDLAGQVNLDYAATTPALQAAVAAVLRALPAYGSVHRGGGIRSRLTTAAYEEARESVGRFVDCGDEHVVVFVRNTTEAINLVAAALPIHSRILCSPLEHHANLLPWRSHDVDYLPFAASQEQLVDAAESTLASAARAGRAYDVLAVTGASNVTGELPPVRELVAVARRNGAQVLLDAAQLAPHRSVSVRELDVDYLALSGHKLYAPFGTGVLVVRRDLLQDTPPLLKGGGAVRAVTLDEVAWADLPSRLEAGTPNVLGAIALAGACEELARFRRDTIEARETELAERLWSGLRDVPGCRVLRIWPDGERVAVATFALEGLEAREVARRLADEFGIAVRSGLFCAHPFVTRLLGVSESEMSALLTRAAAGEDVALPGAVRASIGIGVTTSDIDRLLDGLAVIAARPRRAAA